MTSRDFCYWLQGFFEISNAEQITIQSTEIIKKHLNLVFFHEIDPSYSSDPKVQEAMNNIHEGIVVPNIVGYPDTNEIKPNRPSNKENLTILRC